MNLSRLRNTLSLLSCLLLGSVAAGAALEMTCLDKSGSPKNFFQPDDLLGYRPGPGEEYFVTAKADGRPVFSVVYAIDPLCRRITPVADEKGRDRYLLFFGCSLTFGHGVNATETLPFYAGDLARRYRPYNYGCDGYGPHQMLALLSETKVEEEVKEKDGLLVYLFIDHHIRRALGAQSSGFFWAGPCYLPDKDGKPVRKGNFAAGRPLKTAFYRLVNRSPFLQRLFGRLDLPLWIGDRERRLVTRLLEESRDTYRRKFGNDRFYVVFFRPGPEARRLMPYLKRAGLPYLVYDLQELQVPPGDLELSPYDGHPAPAVYKAMARCLLRDLRKAAALNW